MYDFVEADVKLRKRNTNLLYAFVCTCAFYGEKNLRLKTMSQWNFNNCKKQGYYVSGIMNMCVF